MYLQSSVSSKYHIDQKEKYRTKFSTGAEHQDGGGCVDSSGKARDEGRRRSEFRLEAVWAKVLPSLGSQAWEDLLLPQQGTFWCWRMIPVFGFFWKHWCRWCQIFVLKWHRVWLALSGCNVSHCLNNLEQLLEQLHKNYLEQLLEKLQKIYNLPTARSVSLE